MTVIKRKQQNYDYPTSNTGSDTESLHLRSETTSDNESAESELHLSAPCTSRIKVSVYEEFATIKRNCGKRKQRRFKNRTELFTLSEEEEDETQLVKLMEDYKSPFARLLENAAALKYWNEFSVMSEEEQIKLTDFASTQNQQPVSDKEEPLSRISSKIKRAMKIKKTLPMDMIKKLEEELINYFLLDPQGVFFSTPITSFERLLLHAIAQYHNLRSISYFGDAIRNVEVFVHKKLWVPTEVRFCDYVETLRH